MFIKIKHILILLLVLLTVLFSAEESYQYDDDDFDNNLMRLGDFAAPTNPEFDRAMGFLIKGKIKSTILNYGNYIDIDYDRTGPWDSYPVGLWGEYAYLPQVGFMAGIPGIYYAYKFNSAQNSNVSDQWEDLHIISSPSGNSAQIWQSYSAYSYWFKGNFYQHDEVCDSDLIESRFVGIIFENYDNHKGIVGENRKDTYLDCGLDSLCQYNQDGTYNSDYSGPDEGEANCIFDEFESLLDDLDNDDQLTTGVQIINLIDDVNQFAIDHENQKILISVSVNADPNKPNAYYYDYPDPDAKRTIGFIYPWALRPILEKRDVNKDYDNYDYTGCGSDWRNCENLDFHGATVSESWFDRGFDIDWQASTDSREETHNQIVTTGDIFGDTPFTDPEDSYPVLAHSNFSQTWPTEIDIETGEEVPFWPGWFADKYEEELPGCDNNKKDPDCWMQDSTRFTSDSDVYLEFDDRWAHLANDVTTNNLYETKGYPMGLRVKSTAHSYGVSYAEDIMFVTVRVRNESGDYCAFERDIYSNEVPILDKDGFQVCGEGMVLPDGSKINEGKGFDYEGTSLGFYFDADAATQDINGNDAIHSNEDDFMEYLDTTITINNEELIISMATIYDYDDSDPGLGIVGVQLLDSPLATDTLTQEIHGIDRIPGQKLKMTDWHWFDWYTRPGNKSASIPSNPSDDKELIQYKLMTGDTTNLKTGQKQWYFHTSNPALDSDQELIPHFDSLEGIELEDVFDGGLDCVLIMSCGPFNLKVGEEVPFSFTIIFGEDQGDIERNATFAQIMYNNHYQGFTAPDVPIIDYETDLSQVTLLWDDGAERSKDVVSEYADFEGYRIYKSTDAGLTWGDPVNKIYDNNGIHDGWRPIAQFDLPDSVDINHCIFETDDPDTPEDESQCPNGENRGRDISGPDPMAPWFNLGNNEWLEKNEDGYYEYIDRGHCRDHRYLIQEDCEAHNKVWMPIIDGINYTYSITSYDMGIDADFTIEWSFVDSLFNEDGSSYALFEADTVYNPANPNHWSSPFGYQSIESPKGTTTQDVNFITVKAGYNYSTDTEGLLPMVVPNPYYVHSYYNENEWVRQLEFTNLPGPRCTIKIYTVTGELVNTLDSADEENYQEYQGFIHWNLRTVNNQEIAPGLYIYVVESDNSEKFIGKFAVVR